MTGPCPRCRYFRPAQTPQLFKLRQNAGPGELAAARKYQELQKERAQIEQGIVAQGDPMYVKPQFFPWCERFTLTPEQAAQIQAAFLDGDDAVEESWRSRGFGLAVDRANGEVRKEYALCLRKNPKDPDYTCQAFEPPGGGVR